MVSGQNMSMIALITGITGQDGSYLAEHLLDLGYEVHGIIRRSSSINTGRIDHIFDKIQLHYGDMTDPLGLRNIIYSIGPDEVYNLAAQSHVKVSFEMPEYTANADALGSMRLLEILRDYPHDVRLYQASTSELYGNHTTYTREQGGLNERSPMRPVSPYGAAKLYAYNMTQIYRDSYGLFAANGILFNHESPRRGATFVTQKVARGINNIVRGQADYIELGDVDPKRDWSHAKDMVRGMHMMLQADHPSDYVMGSGVAHSVRDMVDVAFSFAGMDLEWDENGFAIDQNDKIRVHYNVDKYMRPNELHWLKADSTKAKEELDWEPEISFEDMIQEMVEEEMK
jgi:GDPmannose 4,6-dehydratase